MGEAVTTDRIYYTGGLYSGLGAAVRGIPTEDIMDSAVTSRKIADNTIRLEDLSQEVVSKLGVQGPPGPTGATGPAGPQGAQGPPGVTPSISTGAGLYANLSGSTWTIGIANQGVTRDMIANKAVRLTNLDTEDTAVWRQAGEMITGKADYYVPLYYGRQSTYGDTTGYTTGYIPNYYGYNTWQIKPDREGYTYLLFISNFSEKTGIDKYVFEYHISTGYVLGVWKMDNGMPLEGFLPSPDGTFYVFDNAAFGAKVFENPSNYIFDLNTKVVRQMTSGEKSRAEEWLAGRLENAS